MGRLSVKTLQDNLLAKEFEITSYTHFKGSPSELVAAMTPAVADYHNLLVEDYIIYHPEEYALAFKNMLPALRAQELFLIDDVKALESSHFVRLVQASSKTMLDKRYKDMRAKFIAAIGAYKGALQPHKAAKRVIDDPEDHGDETETDDEGTFAEVTARRIKRGHRVDKPVPVKMPLAAFNKMVQVDEDGTPSFDDKDCSFAWKGTKHQTPFWRTYANIATVLKGTRNVVPKNKMNEYAPNLLEKIEIHPTAYYKFAEASPALIKASYVSGFMPKQVYDLVLEKGIYNPDASLCVLGRSYTFEEVEKAHPGAGEAADVIFWQGRAEKLLIDNNYPNKVAFLNKWFPRLLDVPDSVRCGAPEAARHFFEWLNSDMKKAAPKNNPNSTFNGIAQGMLAKWPVGCTRDDMLKKYTPSVKALWGKDLAPVLIEEFKRTPDGQRLVRPKKPKHEERLMAVARNLMAEAEKQVIELKSAATDKVEEIQAKITKTAQEIARLDKALTWREQMAVWRGRFRKSLPDFMAAAPKPLRVLVTPDKKERVMPQTKMATMRRWAAATVGFPFVAASTTAAGQNGIEIRDTVYEPRKWFQPIVDFVYPKKEVDGEVRVYEPLPGLLGTVTAWGETLKYCAYDMPRAAISNLGCLFNANDDEYALPWPEYPPVGTALLGTAWAGFMGTMTTMLVATNLATATAVLSVATPLSLMVRDGVSWLLGTKYDSIKEMWYHTPSVAPPVEEVIFDVEGIVPPAAIEATPDMGEIALTDNRSKTASPEASISGGEE